MPSGEIAWVLLPALFLAAILWEAWFPERPDQRPDAARWAANLGLFAVNSLLLMAASGWAEGLLEIPRSNGMEWALASGVEDVRLRTVLVVVLSLLLLDAAGYVIHRLFHRLPMLWRFHEVHHSDGDLDSTTGLRHHILEIALTLAVLQVGSLLIGIPGTVFLAYGAVLTGLQLLQHANVRLPPALDRVLGAVIVTPRLHAVHHLEDVALANSNFGSVLNCWDRLFGTFTPVGANQAASPRFGVLGSRLSGRSAPWSLLLAPFVRRP
jgi:sterol desaturase/sphingolipid hydroxylase (fatty acid hydroxylase superfamily)